MNVTEITVSAGRTFNHPYEQYSNLRPSITITARLNSGEDYEQTIRNLQAKAESLVEDHKRMMLDQLERLYQMGRAAEEMESLERKLKQEQGRLEYLRKTYDEMQGMRSTALKEHDDQADACVERLDE